jgi:hypothetical protein
MMSGANFLRSSSATTPTRCVCFLRTKCLRISYPLRSAADLSLISAAWRVAS